MSRPAPPPRPTRPSRPSPTTRPRAGETPPPPKQIACRDSMKEQFTAPTPQLSNANAPRAKDTNSIPHERSNIKPGFHTMRNQQSRNSANASLGHRIPPKNGIPAPPQPSTQSISPLSSNPIVPPPIPPHPLDCVSEPEFAVEYLNTPRNEDVMNEQHLVPPPIPPHPFDLKNDSVDDQEQKIFNDVIVPTPQPPPPAVVGLPPKPAVLGPPPLPESAGSISRGRGRGRGVPVPVPVSRGTPPRGRAAPVRARGAPATRGKNPFAMIIAEPSPVEASWWFPLIELFVHNDWFFTHVAISATNSSELDVLATGLVNIFSAKKQIFEFLFPLIEDEVKNTEKAGTLFRGNCIASKALSSYSLSVGNEYLRSVLAGPVQYIVNNPHGYEVNPLKIGADENVDDNINNLRLALQFFLDTIIKSLKDCPLVIRKLCAVLRQNVLTTFPDSLYTVVGGFFFLRFICPAIVSPDGFGVVQEIPDEARRPLVLVSKMLQNLANGVEFGKKEEYMIPLNDQIQVNLPIVQSFFDDLAQPNDLNNIKPPYVAVNDNMMAKLYYHVYMIQDKLFSKITEAEQMKCLVPGSELKQLQSVLDLVGTPDGVDIKTLKKLRKEKKKVKPA